MVSLLTHLGVHLQNITLLLVASSSRQLLIAVVTHFLFHYPQLLAFCFLRCSYEIHCNSVPDLRSPHPPVTTSFPVSFTMRRSHAPRKKNPSDIRLYTDGHTDRQRERDTYPPCRDRGGCNNGFASSIHMIPEMSVTFPLPYPSSPASWTLLLLLSVQDSHNISSNDRYHHSLSSLDNNKTEIYLSICLFICLNQLYLQKYTSPKGCCQRRTNS